jgi:hypothetical protein
MWNSDLGQVRTLITFGSGPALSPMPGRGYLFILWSRDHALPDGRIERLRLAICRHGAWQEAYCK